MSAWVKPWYSMESGPVSNPTRESKGNEDVVCRFKGSRQAALWPLNWYARIRWDMPRESEGRAPKRAPEGCADFGWRLSFGGGENAPPEDAGIPEARLEK